MVGTAQSRLQSWCGQSASSPVPEKDKSCPTAVNPPFPAPGITQLHSRPGCLHRPPAPSTTASIPGTPGCSTSLNFPTAPTAGVRSDSSSRLIPVPPGWQLKVLSQIRPYLAECAAPLPSRQQDGRLYSQRRCWQSRMSRTPPWGFWHNFELLPTLGNQKSHRAMGWGQPSHHCADTAKDIQGDLKVLGHPCGTGWACGTWGAAIWGGPWITEWARWSGRR